MTTKARELLEKMTAEYDKSKTDSFDSMFYIAFPDNVLDELEDCGFIVKQNNILGSISLTDAGYREAKD